MGATNIAPLCSVAERNGDAAAAPTMRVTILNNMVTPYTNRLYNRLWRDGVAVSVVSCSRQEANRSWGDNAPAAYPHAVLDGRAIKLGPGRYAHNNTGIGTALAKTKPGFLFINGFYPTMLMGAVWALRNGIPLGLITEGWRETMPNSLAHRIIRPLVLSQCKAIVSPGRKGADYFRKAGVAPNRIFQVPLVPAWDMPEHTPGFHQRPFHLLWCAHLNDAQKNVSFFLDVVEALKARLPDLNIRIVGKGEKEGEVIARLDAAGVTYQHEPSVEWHKMAAVYASARVVLLPSKWEPWGLVCDEAVQCGLPALVSPHVGAGDDLIVHGSNGYVLPLDAVAWVEHCLPLITNEQAWTSFSVRARATAEGRGLERSTGAFIAMLRRL